MTGPRIGSRRWALERLQPGECLYLEAPAGRLAQFMQNVAVDIGRAGLQGKITQSLVLGVEVSTRAVIEIVKVTRLTDDPIVSLERRTPS